MTTPNPSLHPMDVYRRYALGEHDKEHFLVASGIRHPFALRPLSGLLDDSKPFHPKHTKSAREWAEFLAQAVFFKGHDPLVFGHVISIVFQNDSSSKLSVISITKYGANSYDDLLISRELRFWPACENLKLSHRDSSVRRALAVLNLKNYNKLLNSSHEIEVSWDETNAGELASSMELIEDPDPHTLGSSLLSLGLLQDNHLPSLVVDVIYDNTEKPQKIINENNWLVTAIGEQMDELFDPLLVYSPQAMASPYVVPENPIAPRLSHNTAVQLVVDELLAVQKNHTMNLVALLQDFIIPLRTHVLTNARVSTVAIAKVNAVFPPTIDEITRINCIFHDALSRAYEYGYVEIFKVLGTMLPLFYKAYARHQANLLSFHSRFATFVKRNNEYAFQDPEVNKGAFKPNRVESIISDSVLILVRLKLIIVRMRETISAERPSDEDLEIEELTLDEYYRVAIEAIDSFGRIEQKFETGKRIFTPSGKLLTELATGWPQELQIGWINRKVVGVYELLNAATLLKELVVIFSDVVLVLEVSMGKQLPASLADVLMNSLINQKPLPKIKDFPELKVKCWSLVGNIFGRFYETDHGWGISLVMRELKSLNGSSSIKPLESLVYSMPNATFREAAEIIQSIDKAKVLSKLTPFHLFKNSNQALDIYYCAHSEDVYDTEMTKSPLAVLLNASQADLEALLPYHYAVIDLSVINDKAAQLVLHRDHVAPLSSEIVLLENLNSALPKVFSQLLDGHLHSSLMSESLVLANTELLKQFHFLIEKVGKTGDEKVNHDMVPAGSRDLLNYSQFPETPSADSRKETNGFSARSEKVSTKPNRLIRQQTSENTFISRKKSLIQAMKEKFKRKLKQLKLDKTSPSKELTNVVSQASGIAPQVTVDETMPERKKSDFDVVQGKRQKYVELYKPEPHLEAASQASVVDSQSVEQNPLAPAAQSEEVHALKIETLERGSLPNVAVDNSAVTNVSRFRDKETQNTVSPSQSHVSGSAGPGNLQSFHPSHEIEMAEVVKRSSSLGIEVEGLPYHPTEIADLETRNPYANGDTSRKIVQEEGFVEEPEVKTSHADTASSLNVRSNFMFPSRELDQCVIAHPHSADSQETDCKRGPLDKTRLLFASVDTTTFTPAKASDKPEEVVEPETLKKNPKQFTDDVENLGHFDAKGILPSMYSRYSIYETLPISTFNDGQANWVAMSRDSSSNLQAQIEAMSGDTTMHSVGALDLRMIPQSHPFDSSEGTVSTVDFVTFNHDRTPEERIQVSMSQSESMTSFQLISEFSKHLDEEFELGFDDARTLTYEITLAPQDIGRHISFHNELSTDSEYFSLREFVSALDFVEATKLKTFTASSSENTLKVEQTEQEEPWARLDSMVYLSGIIAA